MHKAFQDRRIGKRLGPCRGPDAHQQIAHGGGGAGHLGFQLEGCKIGIAQQGGAFLPQRQRFGGNRAVVLFIAIGPARHPGQVGPLPQVPPGRKLQERHDQ